MILNTSRFFSDRFVFDPSIQGNFLIVNSFWDWCKRIIFWIWSPSSYSDENRRTVSCFKQYLVDTLGLERLQRICTRYTLDLNEMERRGGPLLSRDVAKIVVGAKSLTVEDINEYILGAQAEPRFAGKNSFLELDTQTLAEVHLALNHPFAGRWEIAPITKRITGRPTEWFSRVVFDRFLADRERLQLMEEHGADSFETFIHNMTARIIKREMDVGTLISAPDRPDGKKQFYYVSAKVVTGKGMVSYLFHPASNDTNLEPMRLFRGTSARNSEIDALSTMITDLERELGRTAYESGKVYDPIIQEKLVVPTVEGGHSMGSTLVQYRLANMDHIRTAYLYCGPGLPEKEVKKFNEKNPQVQLIIRRAVKDRWHALGDAHLGYQAPPNVQVDFKKYHAIERADEFDLHVSVWSREPSIYVMDAGDPAELYHKDDARERIRSLFGPLLAKILHLFKQCARVLLNSRAKMERGLKIGSLQAGRWQVEHFCDMSYTLSS